MNATWLIAKYIPDVRRREPRNVGIILFTDKGAISKFHGEDDGRKAKTKKVRSSDNYKAWIAYWRRTAAKGDIAQLISSDRQQNYFVEVGGERLLGNKGLDPDAYLNFLYAELVEEKGMAEARERTTSPERLFERLQITVDSPRPVELDVEGVKDHHVFDYAYKNGVYTLMKQVQNIQRPMDPCPCRHVLLQGDETAIPRL